MHIPAKEKEHKLKLLIKNLQLTHAAQRAVFNFGATGKKQWPFAQIFIERVVLCGIMPDSA